MSRAKTLLTATTIVLYVGLTNAAYAADTDYGKNAGQWATAQLQAIWLAAVSFGACAFLFPGARKPAILFGYLGAVFLTGMMIFSPGSVESMVKGLGKVVSGT